MPRKCTICFHEKVKEIDALIINKAVYSGIARDFNVGEDAVGKHAKNHLQPIIDEANEKAKQEIVDKIKRYREEVNYAPLDKVKMMQDRLLNDLDSNVLSLIGVSDRIGIYREFRGWMQEEAKLGGLYQQEQSNVSDQYKAAVEQLIQARAAKDATEAVELLKSVNYMPPKPETEIIKEIEGVQYK